MKPIAVIAISGKDSEAAARLLIEDGFDVIGVTIDGAQHTEVDNAREVVGRLDIADRHIVQRIDCFDEWTTDDRRLVARDLILAGVLLHYALGTGATVIAAGVKPADVEQMPWVVDFMAALGPMAEQIGVQVRMPLMEQA